MTCSARRSPHGSAWRAVVVIALALLIAACARPRVHDARSSKTATLVPADLALGFLQEIKSRPNRSLLAGEATIPPCRFGEKGTGSAGEYRKLTGQRAPVQLTSYQHWILFKIEDPAGRDFVPAELAKPNAWNYSLRTPRAARTVFGTTDHCIVGPTTEPARKVVEALGALGVAVAAEYAYIVR
jgi:hypothetical protein